MSKKIAMLPGDGIGVEVTKAAKQVLEAISETYDINFEFSTYDIGGSAIDQHGTPLPKDTVKGCKGADAVLLGAVGGPKWDQNPSDLRPERGLLGIRKALDLYANLRPVKGFKQLVHASPLKEEIIQGSDLLIVRELTGGLYFGKPSERQDNGNAVIDTLSYTKEEMERIIDKAFQSAQIRNQHLTSVDKANVLESSKLWREIVEEKRKEYPDVTVDHVLVDAAAMKLITDPTDFDVIVTENMFGDILSDEASVLTGSLGMLPSASLAENGVGLYEPAHGSAPDIAGKGIANPIAMILSAAMMLRYSFALNDEANAIESAVESVINQNYHTADLNNENGQLVNTEEMTRLIIQAIKSVD
ncbi:3-isopropylmalate dehydrogenase [Gracilibacillus halophilus YIM-C55.5]|uniref:3-isopropylmalate dehydrogenase n=1 Tax=Gracilibacillus halophilus YIM-C55.5 TaxID=1308866 RepID=N4WS18_9BACI|nr:3-isopropylmalate dehydrogenase [Gracilibacillus halophilus]ENH97185.1 3-isopropylmalate dehydrogenase [Gracilibacillus halophilus YIM-C55.5]